MAYPSSTLETQTRPVSPKFAARISAVVGDRLEETVDRIKHPHHQEEVLDAVIQHATAIRNRIITGHHRVVPQGRNLHHAITEDDVATLRQRASKEVSREIRAQRRATTAERIYRGLGKMGLVDVTPTGEENRTWLERRIEGLRNRANNMTATNLGVFATRVSETTAKRNALYGKAKMTDGKLVPVRKFNRSHALKVEDAATDVEVAEEQQSIYLSARTAALKDATVDSARHAGFITRRRASSLQHTIAELGDARGQASTERNQRQLRRVERQISSVSGRLDRVMGRATIQVLPAVAEIRTIAANETSKPTAKSS